MGYLRKDMVIDALREDMEDTRKHYEGHFEEEEIESCYKFMERVIDRLPQYYPKNVVEESRWIPVSERLPESGEYILVQCIGFEIPAVAKYEKGDMEGTFYIYEGMPCGDYGIVVEAWRPLPEPYKE